MTIDAENLLDSIMESFGRIKHIRPSDIPDIDLYMDQVTTFMDEKLKVGKSPLYVLTVCVAVICVVAFLVFSVLGLVDFRTDKQKEADYRKELINHSLFDDAKEFAEKILESVDNITNRNTVVRISCIRTYNSSYRNEEQKVVLIEYNSVTYCYSTTKYSSSYILCNPQVYSVLKNNSRVLSKLILEGEDLNILFEEAEK